MATVRKTTRKPAAKPATPRKAATTGDSGAARPAGVTAPKGPAGVKAPDTDKDVMRKKRLIDDVVARCDVKRRDAKPAIEATLEVLGEALAKGEELNLPGLGKVKINRILDKPNAKVIVVRIRQSKGGALKPKEPLAKAVE